MPTINKRFLLALIAVAAVLTGGLAGVHAIQAGRIPDALKRQADRAVEADKPDDAARYLRQYLEFRPDDTDAREQLAALLLGTPEKPGRGSATELLFLYDKILRADPTRHAARREALKACLRLGRYTDAEGHADELLKAFPDDAELWQQQAVAQAGLHKTDSARASFEQAIQFAPKKAAGYQKLAQYLWRDLQRPDEARAVLDRLVAALPDDPEAYLARARFDTFTNDAANPLPDLKKALEVDPKNADALLLMAEHLQRNRDLAGARDCLMEGVRQYPKDVRLIRALAWLELNRGSIGAAVAVLEDGMDRLKGEGDGFELLVPLADLLVQLGETSRTEEIVRKLEGRATASSRMQVKYLHARLAMRQAEWGKAAGLFAELRAEAVGQRLPGLEAQSNLLLALCRQRQADTAAEQDTLKMILNADPNHLAARAALGQSYLNAGMFTEAEREFNDAVKSPYASGPTHATLVRIKASRLKAAGTGSSPEWGMLDRIAGELHRAFGPAAAEPTLLRADLAAMRGDIGTALALLRAEAVRRPGDARIWAATADVTATVAGVSAGLGVLDEAQAAAGDGADLRLARADLYARDPARLRPLEPLADHIDGWADADQLRLLYGLMEVYDRVGDDANVIAMYRRIAARRPADLAVWEAMVERAARAGDAKAFADAKAAATKLDPTGKTAVLCDAWTALAGGDANAIPAAIAAVEKAFGTEPERAEACVALGKLKAASGDSAGAIRSFERACRLEPTRFGPANALTNALARSPDPGPLTAYLSRLARDYRWAGEPYRRVVRSATRGLPADAAKRLIDATRPTVEPVPDGLGWLGDCYLAAGFRDDAMACYTAATDRKASSPDDWLRLAIRTAEGGDPAKAADAMIAARNALPPQFFLAAAAAFADHPAAPKGWTPNLSSAAEKRAYMQARLALKLSRYQRGDATDLLAEYLKAKDLPEADAAWAERNLAMMLVIRGEKADRAEAMKLLERTHQSAGDTPDEQRATAAVLAALSRYLDGEERQAVLLKATKVLEGIAKNPKETPRDAFLLSQLYRAIGTREAMLASIDVMNQLLALDPKNLDYLIAGLDQSLDANQMPLAEQFAARLGVLYPADIRAITSVARYECRVGRPEKALALAEGYTRTADATAGDLPAKQARSAELLDELARMPKVRRTEAGHKLVQAAVERYEALTATRPEAAIAAAGLVAADGRTDDAFTLIERFTRGQPFRLKAAAGLAVLRADGATDRQFGQVRGWLDAALAEEPDSVALRLYDGEFSALRHEYDKAERAYEWVLARDPKNVIALNNLAWVLAPRPDAADRAMDLIARAAAEVGLTGELLDTRARVRIASKQFEPAERDLILALNQEKTPLRLFHLALAKQQQTPPRPTEARDAFRKAKAAGLEESTVHPADRPMYRVMDADAPKQPD